jgi:hypothetical protein
VADAIDTTMLRIDIWGDAVGDAAEHDRLRAHRVVEYIRHRFPTVSEMTEPNMPTNVAGRGLCNDIIVRFLTEDAVPTVAPIRRAG